MKQNLRIGLVLVRPLVLKITAILLKYPTFEDGLVIFHGQKKYKIRVSVNCSVHTKKSEKISILTLKCTHFFGSKLAKKQFNNCGLLTAVLI